MKTYIICECGLNHNGNIEIAKEMIDYAKEAGADAVKFQAYYPYYIAEPATGLYITLTGCRLSMNQLVELKDYCKDIDFLCSAFDNASLIEMKILNDKGMKTLKIPSSKIVDYEYLEYAKYRFDRFIISTGMAIWKEIDKCNRFFKDKHVIFLHCVSAYPVPVEEMNLRVLERYPGLTNRPWGLSDHTTTKEISIAAVAMGAEVIERHVTFDRNMEGPDHRASLTFPEFADMIDAIRNVELAFGHSIKRCMPSEKGNLCRR